mmetsp:Transcript_32149/g.41334  ORF Transcript_32149/g.41334 Transcript_32149/m.41334 type:complete len:422 (+) Transcript_32149:106-1371(+)
MAPAKPIKIVRLKSALKKFRSDYDYVLQSMAKYGLDLKIASQDLRQNYDIVMTAVTNNGLALEFASDELKNDPKIVWAAVSQAIPLKESVLQYASETLRSNRELVVAGKASPLSCLSKGLSTDRDIVLISCTFDGNNLRYCRDYNNDYEIVLKAVRENGEVLQYASDEMKNTYNIVLEAVKQNGIAFGFASGKMKGNREIALTAVKTCGRMYQWVQGDDLVNDYEIIMTAVRNDGLSVRFSPKKFRNNYEIMYTAIQSRSDLISLASPKLQMNLNISLSVVGQEGIHCLGKTVKLFDLDSLNKHIEFHYPKYGLRLNSFLLFLFGINSHHEPVPSISSPSSSSKRAPQSPLMCLTRIKKKYRQIDKAKRTPLLLLNRLGDEALLEFKKNVSQYAGIQQGDYWTALKAAAWKINHKVIMVKI